MRQSAQDRRQRLHVKLARHGRPQTRVEILLEDIALTLHEIAEAERPEAVLDVQEREPWWKRANRWAMERLGRP